MLVDLIHRLAYMHTYTCIRMAKGPEGIDAETKRPRGLIGANCPANPAVPLIKSRAVVSPFVSPFNVNFN